MNKINLNINHKARRNLFLVFAFIMTATLSFLAARHMNTTEAASFQAGDIISDAVMANYNSMSESDINNFMHSKNHCRDADLSKRNRYPNLTYQIRDGHFLCLADQTFNGQSSAHIIWQAAQDYRINPQVLLVLLQKEQSLITDTWPDDQQIRKATGFACTDSAPCDPSKSGFENQIRKAAALYRTVLDGGWTNYPVGNNYVQYHPNTTCGGSNVYIANRATSALYRYTPYQPGGTGTYWANGKEYSCYSYGNENFFKYFTNWFGDTHAIADIKSVYMPEGTYTLNTTAGKVMSFTGTNSGSTAQVADNNGSDLTKFTLERDDYQYYKLKNVATGLYLDVYGGNTDNGTPVHLWGNNDTCAQKWSIEIINAKEYQLRSACSHKALDVNNAASNSNGAKIQIWASNNTNAQKWTLTNISSAPVGDGRYNIRTSGTKALALTDESINNGTKLVTGELHNATTEQFELTRATDGFYRIKNVASNRSLDVSSASTTNGAPIIIYDDNDTCAQRWAIKQVEGGDGVILTSACSSKALDISNGDINQNDKKIQIWESNSTNAQIWKFTTPIEQSLQNGYYTIETKVGENLSLDSDSSLAPKNGTNIHIWHSNSSHAQKFQVHRDSRGYYTVKSLFSEMNLDVYDASKKPGANVQNWTANSTCAQKWIIVPQEEVYSILSACSRLALDVTGGTAKAGTNVRVWSSNKTNAQQWKFHTTNPEIISTGEYTLESALDTHKVLDVAQGSKQAGTNIQLWSKNNTDAQSFYVSYNQPNNTYIFTSKISNLPIDVDNAWTFNGANVKTWFKNNSCAQEWILRPQGGSYFSLISSCGDKVLDVSGAKTINGTNIQIWSSNKTNAQKWKLIKH